MGKVTINLKNEHYGASEWHVSSAFFSIMPKQLKSYPGRESNRKVCKIQILRVLTADEKTDKFLEL